MKQNIKLIIGWNFIKIGYTFQVINKTYDIIIYDNMSNQIIKNKKLIDNYYWIYTKYTQNITIHINKEITKKNKMMLKKGENIYSDIIDQQINTNNLEIFTYNNNSKKIEKVKNKIYTLKAFNVYILYSKNNTELIFKDIPVKTINKKINITTYKYFTYDLHENLELHENLDLQDNLIYEIKNLPSFLNYQNNVISSILTNENLGIYNIKCEVKDVFKKIYYNYNIELNITKGNFINPLYLIDNNYIKKYYNNIWKILKKQDKCIYIHIIDNYKNINFKNIIYHMNNLMSDYISIKFKETTNKNDANIIIYINYNYTYDKDVYGYCTYSNILKNPFNIYLFVKTHFDEVVYRYESDKYNNIVNPLNIFANTYIHEIFHLLGLEHPDDNEDHDYIEDGIMHNNIKINTLNTLMSYKTPKNGFKNIKFTDSDLYILNNLWSKQLTISEINNL